jgi:hypothetical protein
MQRNDASPRKNPPRTRTPDAHDRGGERPLIETPAFRHELKYYISYGEYVLLRTRLSRALSMDPNANADGEYQIRSLYFDDMLDSSVKTKIGGDNEREKIRIRIYNMSDAVIKLESKRKTGQYIAKRSVSLSRAQAEMLMNGEAGALLDHPDPLAKHVYRLMRDQMLRPVVLVDYFREAYLHPAENVRVTFDKELKSGVFRKDLFNPGVTAPVLEEGVVVLEVKFARFLPAFIHGLIQCEGAKRLAISKYLICRKYES